MQLHLWQDAPLLVETTTETRQPFTGRLLHVNQDTIRLPGGGTSVREWIRHPGACAVVPLFRDGTVMMVRQFRYAIGQVFLEVPAGKIDPGELPEVTAARETEEETGLRAGRLEYLGHFYPLIAYSSEIIHLYVAWDLEHSTRSLDSDEFLITVRVPFAEALRMIGSGEINDGKTICALLKCRMWWEQNAPFPIPLD